MKAPRTNIRTKPLHGISVRDTAQAMGTANNRQSTVTENPNRMEFHMAVR